LLEWTVDTNFVDLKNEVAFLRRYLNQAFDKIGEVSFAS
jgi:hypothetical protein